MAAGNPWFRVWPQLGGGVSPVAVQPAPPPEQMKSVEQVLREGKDPSKFVQIVPFDHGSIAANSARQIVVKFDSDLPFRMEAMVFQYLDAAGAILPYPELVAQVLVSLPGGRMLTRSEVDPFALNGMQGGKDFVPYRYRFRPNDLLELTVRNISAAPISARGLVYGYKLTSEDRT